MPKITYIEFGGASHNVEVTSGLSVMEGAVKHGIPGIDADCGGACACATCHVKVDEAWLDRVGAPDANEAQMLEFALDPGPNSRLSCQITVNPSFDGLIVHMPESQR